MRDRGAGRSRRPDAGRSHPGTRTNASWRAEMRTMFVVYLVLIATGILFYSAIGLMHN
jgi:hypothetical protein